MTTAAAAPRSAPRIATAVHDESPASFDVRGEPLPAFLRAAVSSGRPLRRFVAAHPLRTVLAIRSAGRLPLLPARLRASVEGDAIAQELRTHALVRLLFRGTSAVLHVPARLEQYTAGPRRATLRRRMRSAERHGAVVQAVPRSARPELLELATEYERHGAPVEYRIAAPSNGDLLGYDLWMAAYGRDGEPLALTVIPVSGEWAVLRYFRTVAVGPAASDARYLLHAALVKELGRRGVRYLVDGVPPWWLPDGLRQFQNVLGFRLVRLRVSVSR